MVYINLSYESSELSDALENVDDVFSGRIFKQTTELVECGTLVTSTIKYDLLGTSFSMNVFLTLTPHILTHTEAVTSFIQKSY